jgi:cell division protein FtsL
MSKARDNRRKMKKKTNKKITHAKNSFLDFTKNKLFIIIIAIAVIAVIIFGSIYAVNNAKLAKCTKTITKEQAREQILGFNPQISNLRAISNSLYVADSFAAEDLTKDGNKIGEEAVIFIDNPDAEKSKKIPNEAFMLLVVDNDLKIQGLVPFKPTYFDIGGKVDFNKFFSAFKGKTAVQMIKRIDGIYTDDSNTALIIKNKVREAMTLFYIEKYGANKYDKLANGEFIFADRGTKVPDFEFTAVNGKKYKLSDFSNKKIFLVAGNPNCGGCVSSINRLAWIINHGNYDLSDVQFIVFSFSDKAQDAEKLTEHLPGNAIIVADPDRTTAKKVKMDISPYIALINKGLKLYYRGPGEPTLDTTNNIKEFLGGKK